jgi:hypothetical protein
MLGSRDWRRLLVNDNMNSITTWKIADVCISDDGRTTFGEKTSEPGS